MSTIISTILALGHVANFNQATTSESLISRPVGCDSLPPLIGHQVHHLTHDEATKINQARVWWMIDMMMLAISTASLTLDWRQTSNAADERWSGGRKESGYITNITIGSHPSTHAVDYYFVATAVVNTALWSVLPKRWRSVIPGLVIGVEIPTIIGNLKTTHL